MGKHMVRASAKCTYYKGEERHEIYCRGLEDGMGIHLGFSNPADKRSWMDGHCKSIKECEKCPVKKMLDNI